MKVEPYLLYLTNDLLEVTSVTNSNTIQNIQIVSLSGWGKYRKSSQHFCIGWIRHLFPLLFIQIFLGFWQFIWLNERMFFWWIGITNWRTGWSHWDLFFALSLILQLWHFCNRAYIANERFDAPWLSNYVFHSFQGLTVRGKNNLLGSRKCFSYI